ARATATSALFPYTTLFRSADALALGAAHAVKVANVGHKVWIFGFDGDVAGLKAVRDGTLDATMTQKTQGMGKLALDSALDIIDGDRKSTRLNSSHDQISYA